MPVFTNISAYLFAPLADLKELRARLQERCRELGLKGTILLSTEGVNLFIAGGRGEVDALVDWLRAVSGLEKLTPKYSESAHQPFNRMLVRIKKEIIAFGVEGIEPARRTSPKLAARDLKQWLDEGRPVTLLDTRNDYEVKLGTFKNALTLDIGHFRDFPAAVARLPAELKQQPVVMFCTGGIRCEKAGPFMEREGFEHIHQLDGGILKYFEECGAAHYEGECFVFDQRVGVDPALRETGSALCYACQTPLDAGEQADPRHVPGVSCPYCFKTTAEQMAARIAERQQAITQLTTPLPGATPYENRRPLHVPGEHDGQSLIELLVAVFPHIAREEWLRRCELGRFLDEKGRVRSAGEIVRAGEQLAQIIPATAEPPVNADIRILHEDEALVVLHKPAPLPTHPSGRYNRNTLQHILAQAYAPQRPRPVHRLDANTTGLLLCARTRHFAGLLQAQFKSGGVEKIYLVRAQGRPAEERFVCEAPISDEPGALGAHVVDEDDGQQARTEFTVRKHFDDGDTLLEARLITGRTNQIRAHLWHLGLPVRGDAAFLSGGELGDTQTLAPEASPLCLHAWRLAFNHPLTKQRLTFEALRPEWAD